MPSFVATSTGATEHGGDPAQTLAHLAVTALVDEAELTPKPALVDRRGNGAHHDLDLARLCGSARSLGDGLVAIARAAAAEPPSPRLREELGRIGRDMERAMLAATGGGNAHRGAIWALGLLVAAAAQTPPRSATAPSRAAATAARAAALARLPDRFAPRVASHGEHARLRYGVSGARGEAQAGFPHALRIGVPTLRAARRQGRPEPCARLDALLAIMATLDDTCLLHRGGQDALTIAKTGARAVLTAGGAGDPIGLTLLYQLHADLMARWASPGGSGDLLAVTLFLDRLDDGAGPIAATAQEAWSWRS
ncbi:MAG TPA: triphosphoribosyl-dephospho-CoA synthase [Kofleriaceae bacterium]|nr:triphosphoribosyl-dephospho-CoA synthase [Kofleriaceae bacterium]